MSLFPICACRSLLYALCPLACTELILQRLLFQPTLSVYLHHCLSVLNSPMSLPNPSRFRQNRPVNQTSHQPNNTGHLPLATIKCKRNAALHFLQGTCCSFCISIPMKMYNWQHINILYGTLIKTEMIFWCRISMYVYCHNNKLRVRSPERGHRGSFQGTVTLNQNKLLVCI